MKTKKFSKSKLSVNNSFRGKWLAEEINKMMENNEPISSTIQTEYTRPEDGVLPQHDIRTDKFDLIQSSMDKATKAAELRKTAAPPETPPAGAGEANATE